MSYYCGVDIGGTFTDCVIMDDEGEVTQTKTSTTPDDRSRCFMTALEQGAQRLDLTLDQLLSDTKVLLHGTTVGTNTLVQKDGAKTGLITTRGHADALIMMRTAGRSKGLPLERLLHVSRHRKPEPMVPRSLIREVTERVDWAGDVVAPLDLEEARAAVQDLVDQGVESIAICFLWGFVNPEHEAAVREIVLDVAPDVYVTCAHELIGKPGEYERTAGTVINAYLGPATSSYVRTLDGRTSEHGYQNSLLIMQANGGVAAPEEVCSAPLFTIGSGPVGGLIGSDFLGRHLGHRNIIATDMGGTSFDVGIVAEGQPLTSAESVVNQYTFFMPSLAIESIGAGGGSILSVPETSRVLRVGPESAQAVPGPACYRRGGEEPTVTDANVALGFYGRSAVLSGGLELDHAAAETAVRRVAEPLGLSVHETAAGAKRIVENHMGGLIRQLSVQRGLDPREFVIYAYGGAAGLHAAGYAREVGVDTVIVPGGNLASGWSALGVLSSDLLHVHERAKLSVAPFSPAEFTSIFDELERTAADQLRAEGVAEEAMVFERSIDMQFTLQIHQVEVPAPSGDFDDESVRAQVERFVERYEQVYGQGSAFREAGVQAAVFRVRAKGVIFTPDLPELEQTDESGTPGSREIYWPEAAEVITTPVHSGAQLSVGTTIEGPAIVDFPSTQVAVPPGVSAARDTLGNLILTIGKAEKR